MKNSDFIKMQQCNIYSIKFPTDNIKERIEQAIFDTGSNLFKIDIVKNPMTGEKVQVLKHGIFFTLRIIFKKITRQLLTEKVYELKNSNLLQERGFTTPESEKEWKAVAEEILFSDVPFSSELVNVFYSPEKEILFVNSHSVHSNTALTQLIKLFDLVGFRSIAVSAEKLGLNAKLIRYLEKQDIALFKYLSFQNEVTLRKKDIDTELFLTCRHLDTKDGQNKALEALHNGFVVQSMTMKYEIDDFVINFKLDEHLKIRSLRFAEYAYVSKSLDKPNVASKHLILCEYLEAQLSALLNIASCTVLEFVEQTNLDDFV